MWYKVILALVLVQTSLAKEKPLALAQYTSETCAGGIVCPSNFLYYFACCADECCLRLQPVPAVVLGAFAALVAIGIIYAVCCFMCCRRP